MSYIENCDEVLITREMILAGILEAREHPLGVSLESLMENVYIAMSLAKSDAGLSRFID